MIALKLISTLSFLAVDDDVLCCYRLSCLCLQGIIVDVINVIIIIIIIMERIACYKGS